MNKTIHDKTFKSYLTNKEIENKIDELAKTLNELYMNETEPVVFVPILNGSFIFASQLFTKLTFPVVLDTVKVSSYDGTKSVGLTLEKENSEDLTKKKVILVEDIIDTGQTIDYLLYRLYTNQKAFDVQVVSLLFKPDKYNVRHHFKNKHDHIIGFTIPDKFVVGYGLDYNGLGRNLNEIMILDE